jgi:signal transduction histidine kinase/DNA-binding response OmpR family regulator
MVKEGAWKAKLTVIIGYILVFIVLIAGLSALYRNLVEYSNKKVNSDYLTEMVIVSNTLSLLYEIESEQNLLTPSSTRQYFINYDSIIPEIEKNLLELHILSQDSSRRVKLDSISQLIKFKRDNLNKVVLLLDSIKEAPQIVRETHSSFELKGRSKEISDYIDKSINTQPNNKSDTTIISKERKGFFARLRNVFVGRPDSTIVIENRSGVNNEDIKLIIDTVVNKVQYSERLDMSRQVVLQAALLDRQIILSNTNRMLTDRIDELLKDIEQEEIRKSIQLLEEKEYAISRSQKIIYFVSVIALIIALLFAILFLIDINKSQRYRNQLEKSNQQISELLASRQKLMLTISHDIKAPISSILGFIELLRDDFNLDLSKDKRIDYLQNMSSSANHVMQLVTTLLDYTKLHEGKWEFKNSNFDLHHLVNNITTSFRPIAEQKGLNYYVVNKLPVDKKYLGDPYVLRQILTNLISNAIKYTNRGEIRITVKEKTAAVFYFSVSDTGIGIDLNDQKLIFNEFKQVANEYEYENKIEGSGLGLAITKRLVNELDGSIYLTSKKGLGSEFTIEIPLKSESSAPITLNNIGLIESHDHKQISVFVIEDDLIQLKMVTEMIRKKGMICTGVTDSEEVVLHLRNNIFDIIFIDINLQATTGIELIREIYETDKDLLKDIPIIVLSAASDITKDELQSHGFTDFLPKPFTSEDLFEMIKMHTNSGEIINEEKKETSLGVMSLIEYVKDDDEQSTEILQSFIIETTLNNKLLEVAFEQNDYISAQRVAHKILPLIKMIGDNRIVTMIEQLEKGPQLTKEMEGFMIVEIDKYVTEAEQIKTRINEFK